MIKTKNHRRTKPVTFQSCTSFSWNTCCGFGAQKNEITPLGDWKYGWILVHTVPDSWRDYGGKIHMHPPAHASIIPHIRLWHSDVWSFFSVARIRTLDKSEVMVQCHRIPECYCQSGASLTAWKHCCGRFFFFSRVIPHATQTELSRNDSVNMTVNSA